MLRQQEVIADDKPNRSLADFVAPIDSGITDYVGAFAVTAGIGVDALVKKYEAAHDDYSAIIVKAIADRLAEAFAEYLHAQARKDWGFGDALSNDDLIDEKYRGIRPAFGYPACPDHSEKGRLFALLDARSQGLDLTESFAMTPAASVSGLYFAHPQSKYFAIQRVGPDQVEDYARRKGMSTTEVERWLRPVLAYDPALGERRDCDNTVAAVNGTSSDRVNPRHEASDHRGGAAGRRRRRRRRLVFPAEQDARSRSRPRRSAAATSSTRSAPPARCRRSRRSRSAARSPATSSGSAPTSTASSRRDRSSRGSTRRCSTRSCNQVQANLVQARANLTKARSELDRARVQLTDAQQKFARAKELSSQQLLPASELDAAKIAVDSATGVGGVAAGDGRAGAGGGHAVRGLGQSVAGQSRSHRDPRADRRHRHAAQR